MITVHPADDRGLTEQDWLESWHSFSFGGYFEPDRMGFKTLRVLNDDRVQPGQGFGQHGHRDMEIVSYVLSGTMEHKDNLGNGSLIKHGEVQRMSAGTGIQHSEWNPSDTEPLHFLQVWIVPEKKGLEPSYEQKAFDVAKARQDWVILAAPAGGLVTLHQDVAMATTLVATGQSRTLEFDEGRAGYLFVAKGAIKLHGNELRTGDAVSIEDERELRFESDFDAEVIVFDIG